MPSSEQRMAAQDAVAADAYYTIQTVTVQRVGNSKWHDLKIVIPGGETREVRVRVSESVNVASPK